MNFLAHTYLSFESPGLIVGNYLGDFIRNKDLAVLPVDIKNGVLLHRAIDSYTDRHEMVKKGTSLLHNSMGKYAPVVLDIYFDFLLSKRWSDFNDDALSDYCLLPYRVLMAHEKFMSERIANRMNRMVADRWLENYQSYEGIARVFRFLAKRVRFKSNLINAPHILKEMEAPLEEVFMVFFPDLISHCQEKIDEFNSSSEKEAR
ncbi:MAG: DUF479 domain-containing protein [Saprospiraceae bacterium]|nr:DUF479 domain-containing protein [Saprospiraceae bacterium]